MWNLKMTANLCNFQLDKDFLARAQQLWVNKWINQSIIKVLMYLPKNLQVQFSDLVMSNSLQPMDCSMPDLPVHPQLLEFTQTHVHWLGDAIQPSHPLSPSSPPTFNLSQHQGLFKWVSSSHQVAKVLEFQLQHQFFQWIFRTDFF